MREKNKLLKNICLELDVFRGRDGTNIEHLLNKFEIKKIFLIFNLGVFYWGEGGGWGKNSNFGMYTFSLTQFFFCTDLLVGFKLGYTPNFNLIGHLEVP